MTRYLSSSTLAFLAILGFLAFWIGGGMLNREPPAEAAPEVATCARPGVVHRPEPVPVGQRVVRRPLVYKQLAAGRELLRGG